MPQPQLSRNNLSNLRANYLNVAAGATDVSRPVMFADAAAGDDRLAAGASDVDAGEAYLAALDDFLGVGRPLDGDADGRAVPDLGAFEFGHPMADSDGDGLPDAWEVAMGLNPTLNDSARDADGDGASNAHEHAAGTDSRDPRSVLALRVRRLPGGAVEVRWNGVPGRTYAVEHATRPGATVGWQVQQSGLVGDGAELTFQVPGAAEAIAFYRVGVVSR